MDASFEQKSVLAQLVSVVVGLGAYFVVAGMMLSRGVTEVVPYVPVFAVAVVFMVIVIVAGHIVAAIGHRSHEPDERDKLIAWKAESRSSWILAVGVFGAITAMLMSLGDAWVANILIASLFVSQVLCYVLQLVSYQRGL